MKDFLVILLIFSFSLHSSASYDESKCSEINTQIDQIHKVQLGLKNTSGQSLKESIVSRKNLVSMHEEVKVSTEYTDEEKEKKISVLGRNIHKHDIQINDVMGDSKFTQLSNLNRKLAGQYLQNCEELHNEEDANLSVDAIKCINDGLELGDFPYVSKFGEDVMDAITKYMFLEHEKNLTDEKLQGDCKKLIKSGIRVDACLAMFPQLSSMKSNQPNENPGLSNSESWCPKGQEYYQGKCRQKCLNTEYRKESNPGACVPDEEAQLAKNQRKQNSKASWGKVARIGGIAILAGGAALGMAWGVKKIFSINENEYHYDINMGPVYNNTYTTDNRTSNRYTTNNNTYNVRSPSNNFQSSPYDYSRFLPSRYGYGHGGGYGYGNGYSGMGFNPYQEYYRRGSILSPGGYTP